MTTPDPRAFDWANVRALFEAALALPPAEREALLADPALPGAHVAEVRSLLRHTQDTSSFLAEPAALLSASLLAEAASERAGQRLGAWRITERLGRGGMGEVWLAERADGAFVGHAAIKVLRQGLDSASVLARFALEQQALARLSHPHIAHLLDAGRTADGLPYFVMEYVRGQPIDLVCVAKPLAERLALFLQLADAVAHAHRQLMVHRDLKPSNVLVNEAGQVKLLDFGIAKALDAADVEGGSASSADPEATQSLTRAGERPFSPRYASPEQVRGEPVSTATDVYSLGVLLYVMLTGVSPYGRSATTPQAAARSVLEEAPTRPSSVALPEAGWEVTRRALMGDLDHILLKALEKEPQRRYVSVDAMAADVQAYLQGRPVSARPARALYVLSKFVARNRLATMLSATALLAVVGGSGLALEKEREASLQRDLAQRRFGNSPPSWSSSTTTRSRTCLERPPHARLC
jgi:eukaryotic-like serine/threonine-protein kinase